MTEHRASGTACPVWSPEDCVGTEHCPPRCPRFVDHEGTPLLIREFEADDRAALVEMYEDVDARSRTLGLPPRSQSELEHWLDSLTRGGWNLLAFERGTDRVVGHIGAAPADGDEPEFVVFVRDGYRGRGLGTELVQQAVAHAAARDHDALGLDVARDNDLAVAVYENVGFEIDDETALDVSMRLSMDSPVATRARLPPAQR